MAPHVSSPVHPVPLIDPKLLFNQSEEATFSEQEFMKHISSKVDRSGKRVNAIQRAISDDIDLCDSKQENLMLRRQVEIARRATLEAETKAKKAKADLDKVMADKARLEEEAAVRVQQIQSRKRKLESLKEELQEVKRSHPLARKIVDLEEKNEKIKDFIRSFGKLKLPLDDACLKMLMEQKPSKAEAEHTARLRELVNALLKSVGITADIAFYGSRENGFGSTNSDFDITIRVREGNDAVYILSQFTRALKMSHDDISKINFVSTARVPVVKFQYKDKSVDVCVNNELGFANTKLLRAYCSLDPRVGLLGRLVKTWAKQANICGSQDGYFNSYAFILLTIYYLQNCEKPVVPNLQDQGQEPEIVRQDNRSFDVSFSVPVWKSENTESSVSLFRGFLKFYGQEFEWEATRVSIKQSSVNISNAWSIIDPFDLQHDLARQVGRFAQQQILTAFRTSYAMTISSNVNKFKKLYQSDPKPIHSLKLMIRGNQNPIQVLGQMFGQYIPKCVFIEPCDHKQVTVFLLFQDQKEMEACSCITPPPNVILLNVLSDTPPTHCVMSGGPIYSRPRY